MNLAKSNVTLPLYWAALVCDQDEIMETFRIVMSFGFLKLFLHYRTVSWVSFSYILCTLRFIWCWSGCKCLKEVERRKECSGTCACMLVDIQNTANSYNYWVCKFLLLHVFAITLHILHALNIHIFLQFINLVLNFFKAVLLLWGKDVGWKSLVAGQPSLTLGFLFQLVFREVTSVSPLITYCLMHVKASFPEIVHGNFASSIF